MSGKQEKRKRREQGISVDAKRSENEFARLVVQHRSAREIQRERRRLRKRKGLAIGALAVLAALAAAGIGAVL